jgi:hypothetical protein
MHFSSGPQTAAGAKHKAQQQQGGAADQQEVATSVFGVAAPPWLKAIRTDCDAMHVCTGADACSRVQRSARAHQLTVAANLAAALCANNPRWTHKVILNRWWCPGTCCISLRLLWLRRWAGAWAHFAPAPFGLLLRLRLLLRSCRCGRRLLRHGDEQLVDVLAVAGWLDACCCLFGRKSGRRRDSCD